MIKLDDLKTVLQNLNLDADTIEAIQGLDKEDDSESEIKRLNDELKKVNDEWNQRFRDAFFKGEGIPHDHEGEVTEQVDEQAGDDEKDDGLATTVEELFGNKEE